MGKRRNLNYFVLSLLFFILSVPSFTVASSGKEKASISIYKYEQEKGSAVGEEGDGKEIDRPIEGSPLAGVEFTIEQTHSYDPKTNQWRPVDQAPFTLVTNSDGLAFVDQLELGRYTIQETDGPPHVVLNKESFRIDLPMTSKDGQSLLYDVHIYPKNEIIRGAAKLIKKKDGTEATLDGVQFKVFTETGEAIEDEQGQALVLVSKNGSVEISGLAYGNYYFQEIASVEGYLLNGEKVYFQVSKQDDFVERSLQNYAKPEVEKTIDREAVNRGEEVTYTIIVNLPEDIRDYKRFVIKDDLDPRLAFVSGSQSNPAGFQFSQEGQSLLWTAENMEEIQAGTLTISFKAKVKKDAPANEIIENRAIIEYDNRYVTGKESTPPVTLYPTVGSLSVKKLDGNSKKGLEGAVFELRDETGKLVASGSSDRHGKVDFQGVTDELDYGKYILTETKAPQGYHLLQKPIELVIDQEHSDLDITVDNYQTAWELPKTGGIGTMLFTMVGFSLMGTASFMFLRRRKEEEV